MLLGNETDASEMIGLMIDSAKAHENALPTRIIAVRKRSTVIP
ncbi:hypothetical protein ALT1644_360018 [Alteromonas macleodii]